MGVMIVCICKNINSSQFMDCLKLGMTVDDISAKMGLGTGCGQCLEHACNAAEKESKLIVREQ